jgi:outer membrane protein OmpA-like peptidoglycan-associated protein
MRDRIVVIALAAVGLAQAGCRLSASASGSVKSSGDAQGTAQASTEPVPAPAPAAAPPSAITYSQGKLDYTGVINFEYDKAELRVDAETQKTLGDFKGFLEQNPQVKIEVEGHTDSRASNEYNRELSDRRAAAVRKWLIGNGVAEDRITSIGKGEDDPQVPEPPECKDKHPEQTAPCEGPWAQNRRVVFKVTAGAETLPPPPAPAPPAPVVAAPEPAPAPPPPPARDCPWLFGPHLNPLGPNSWVTVAGATQPGVCWLELSLGLGVGFGDIDAEDPPPDAEGDGRYLSVTVPLRARIWFMDRHSLLGDLGLGFTHYDISADLTDSAGVTGEYDRDSTPFLGHFGIGYGYRPNGAQAGPRLAVLVGGLIHLSDLDDSELSLPAGFNAAEAALLQAELDDDSDRLPDFEPYAEISFGYLF